jgi:glutathionylspermidine synthase
VERLARDARGRDRGGERPYWDESVHYAFSADEVAALRADVELLHSMSMAAVDHVVTTERFADFALPEWTWESVAASWRRHDPHVCGRLDLRYDGRGPAKLLEYDADAPRTLLEAAILQADWIAAVHPADGQWNSLHDALVQRWAAVAEGLPGSELHVTWSVGDETGDDRTTAEYLQETAAEAGIDTVGLTIEDIGWDPVLERFVDLEEAPMTAVLKMYPWEWVLGDRFGEHVLATLPATLWIEPLWKALLSDKALLAVLWELYPGHPNLLPAYLDQPGMLTEYVRKPRRGRDGANITVVAPGSEVATGGVYGEEGYVYQLFDPLPEFDGYRPALGAWVIGDTAAGLGIRESAGLVTDDGAAFVPHRVLAP